MSWPTQRGSELRLHRFVLAALAAQALLVPAQVRAAAQLETSPAAIRPFRSNVPDAVLVDLRRRVVATRWPDKETVPDRSQGVQRAAFRSLR
jgi:hypothetical protein